MASSGAAWPSRQAGRSRDGAADLRLPRTASCCKSRCRLPQVNGVSEPGTCCLRGACQPQSTIHTGFLVGQLQPAAAGADASCLPAELHAYQL